MLAAAVSWVTPAQAGNDKFEVCHVPPGNAANFHTITVSANAVDKHLAHGDFLGACDEFCAELCDDGDACTVSDNALCEVDGCPPQTPVDCDDSDICTADTCDSATGACVYTTAPLSTENLECATRCTELLAFDPTFTDGFYSLNVDRDRSTPNVSVQCDMTNGGWMRLDMVEGDDAPTVATLEHFGDTSEIRGTAGPVLGTNTFYTDPIRGMGWGASSSGVWAATPTLAQMVCYAPDKIGAVDELRLIPRAEPYTPPTANPGVAGAYGYLTVTDAADRSLNYGNAATWARILDAWGDNKYNWDTIKFAPLGLSTDPLTTAAYAYFQRNTGLPVVYPDPDTFIDLRADVVSYRDGTPYDQGVGRPGEVVLEAPLAWDVPYFCMGGEGTPSQPYERRFLKELWVK
ncbi:MAG: hypothetical protein CVU56_23935 [Deltaproteobacteria bacterium HGW-Deltaproteobacteria-14]|nr:MAG: hypothetical protein CVU56_23935 [Deltaproteobacteria bacterium HGW-Deltaproteobacteria-14]